MLRAVLYARVSTTNHHQDPEMQLGDMRPVVAQRGWSLAGEYVDRCTGSKESRPELNRLLADAKRGKFDIVMVWKLDRFARSLKQLVNALAEFEAMHIQFVSLRDNLDLTTPSGRLMFGIIAAMAEFERSLIQERVRAGLASALRKGKKLGRPQVGLAEASRQTIWRRKRAAMAPRMALDAFGGTQGPREAQIAL